MLHMNIHYLVLYCLLLLSHTAFAQEDEEANVVGFKLLDYGDRYLPENLTSTKSVVFVSVPPISDKSSERGNWKSLANTAHETFREVGIDPVKYYYLDDVMAGSDVSRAIAQEMSNRNIENIIILSHVELLIKGKETERYVLLITPFTGDSEFIHHGQGAWKQQDKKIDKALKSLERDVSKSGQPKENLLILEQPEFFEGIDIIEGERLADFTPDLRIDRIAVPKFAEVNIPDNAPGGLLNKQIIKEMEEYNASVERKNRILESIMADYPFDYKFIEGEVEDEKALRNQGFHFILKQLNTSGASIKNLLEYESIDMGSKYVTYKQNNSGGTILRSIPKDAPVYKYYLKHTFTGDVNLGPRWDADETWDEALRNFIVNLKMELEKE